MNTPIKFCSEAYFFRLRFFNEPESSDSGPPAWSPSRRTCAQDFYVLKKSIDLSHVWTREPWISRRACYPETTEADYRPLSAGLPSKIMQALLPSSTLATCHTHLNLLDLNTHIKWMIQTMKFLIVESSPLPILIPVGPKYSGRN